VVLHEAPKYLAVRMTRYPFVIALRSFFAVCDLVMVWRALTVLLSQIFDGRTCIDVIVARLTFKVCLTVCIVGAVARWIRATLVFVFSFFRVVTTPSLKPILQLPTKYFAYLCDQH
jgi:hypothetical protein